MILAVLLAMPSTFCELILTLGTPKIDILASS